MNHPIALKHPSLFHQEEFTVRTYEIDSHKLMTPPAILNLMHEAAMQNVIKMKVSVWDLEPHQISWVLMRMDLKIIRLPQLGEQISVCTYPAGFEKFFTYRDYLIFDSKGERIAYSSSTWVLMDTVARKLRRIPPFLLDMPMPKAADCLARIRHKLPPFDTSDQDRVFKANWYDLDFNEHLNSVVFVKWMLQSMDAEVLSTQSLAEIDIQYHSECRWKEEVKSEVKQVEKSVYLHRLLRIKDEKPLAIARTYWK